MEAWNLRLIEPGTELVMRRRELSLRLEALMADESRALGNPFQFSMRYESTLVPPEGIAQEEIQQCFHERLVATASEEMRRGVTLTGPHRDDIQLCLGPNDLRRYGSQGQRRLFAVLLKLAELAHIESELHEPCVLLLDDVFSEFDAAIMSRLQHLFESQRQVLVTTPVELPKRESEHTRVLHVQGGRVHAG
jgi:DNA replication and repair protein RecF